MKLFLKTGFALGFCVAVAVEALADTSDTERPARDIITEAPANLPVADPGIVTSSAGRSIRERHLRTLAYTETWLADRDHRPAPDPQSSAVQPTVHVSIRNIVRTLAGRAPYYVPHSRHSNYLYVGSGFYRLIQPYRFDLSCRYLSDCPCRYLSGC